MKEFGQEVLNLSNMVCELHFCAHFLSSYSLCHCNERKPVYL